MGSGSCVHCVCVFTESAMRAFANASRFTINDLCISLRAFTNPLKTCLCCNSQLSLGAEMAEMLDAISLLEAAANTKEVEAAIMMESVR